MAGMEGAKKRRRGVIEPPTMDEIYTPPKRARALELVGATPATEPGPGRGQRACFAQWSQQEVAAYLVERGLSEPVARAMRGRQGHMNLLV